MASWFRHNSLILTTTILIIAVQLTNICSLEKWEDAGQFFAGDIKGYYTYLPAFFIHDDIKLLKAETHLHTEKGEELVWYVKDKDGNRFLKYPIGLALVMTPAFLIAHNLAEISGYEANGYSLPYMIALIINSIIFSLIAIYFIVRLLRKYFSEYAVIATVLILFLGTNAYHYYTGTINYSHTYSLTIIAAYLYYCDKWINNATYRSSIILGVLVGLMVLIRPIDLVLVLVPFFYRVNDKNQFIERVRYVASSWKKIIVVISVFFCIVSIQLWYNVVSVGEAFHYSYGKETMFLDHPRILHVLFDFRNGWLIYSPLMVFSLLGFLFFRGVKRTFGLFFLIPFFMYLYLISSWWCWWYMGFGNRAVINVYPLLAFPLALAIESIGKKVIGFIALNLIIITGIVLTIFQTYQYDKGLIHWGAMTKEAYVLHFLELNPHQEFTSLLRFPVDSLQHEGINAVYTPDPQRTYHLLQEFNSAQITLPIYKSFIEDGIGLKTTACMHLSEGQEFSGQSLPIANNFESLEIYAWVKGQEDSVHITLSREEPFFYQASNEVIGRNGEWRQLYMFCWVPRFLDTVNFVIWNESEHDLLIDDLEIIGTNHKFTPRVID